MSYKFKKLTDLEIVFYYVHDEYCFNRLIKHADKIDVIIPIAYDVDKDGFVKGGVEPSVLELSSHNSFKRIEPQRHRGNRAQPP